MFHGFLFMTDYLQMNANTILYFSKLLLGGLNGSHHGHGQEISIHHRLIYRPTFTDQFQRMPHI